MDRLALLYAMVLVALCRGQTLPSDAPSLAPSDMPSLGPSDAPSMVPSTLPSHAPSDLPSTAPSRGPSQYPTTTVRPSLAPSSAPSDSPTSLPSVPPSQAPSAAPSDVPSSSPTITCHDHQHYRSPINNLTCSSHAQTSCLQWRHVGLTTPQVAELLEMCPESCRIDCDSAVNLFEITIAHQLSGANTFLGPETAETMEQVAVEYFTNYLQRESGSTRIYVDEVELISQQFATGRLRGRRLQQVDLWIQMSFRGLAVLVEEEDIQEYIIDGIDSPGYTNALQRSADPELAEIRASTDFKSATDVGESPKAENGDGGGPSAGGVAASILFSFSVVGGAAAFFFWNRKRRVETWDTKGAGDSVLNSPAESQRSPLGSMFSFESYVNGVRRALSPRSENSESDTHQESSGDETEPRRKIGKKAKKEEDASTLDEEEEHPFAGIIPPMLVIDNIDAIPPPNSKRPKREKHQNVVPFRKMDASMEMIAALNDRTQPFDASAFIGVLSSAPHHSTASVDPIKETSSFRVVSSEDSSTVTPPPLVTSPSAEKEVLLELRKAVSDGATIHAIDTATGTAVSGTLPPVDRLAFELRRPKLPKFRKESQSPAARRKSRATSPLSAAQGPPMPEPTEAHRRESSSVLPSFMKSLRSGTSRSKSPASYTDLDGPSPLTLDIDKSRSTPTRAHSRQNSRSSSMSNPPLEEGTQFTFEVPRKGKLGLVIECNTNGGPTVTQVKDYSPLLGQVELEDRIINIDGINTSGMTLSDVLRLLAGSWMSNVVRITILRPRNQFIPNDIPMASSRSFDSNGDYSASRLQSPKSSDFWDIPRTQTR